MMLGLKPSRVIGPATSPYMLRWHVFRIGTLPRVFVHKFLRSDYDRALHNHPWWFVSILLRGSYYEHMPDGIVLRKAPSVAFRGLNHRHRIELIHKVVDRSGVFCRFAEQPVWTLFVTGPEVRRWGFFCPKGYVDSADFDGCDDSPETGEE